MSGKILLLNSLPNYAERGGFEPPAQLPVRQFSKLLVSATHPSLLKFGWCKCRNDFDLLKIIFIKNTLKINPSVIYLIATTNVKFLTVFYLNFRKCFILNIFISNLIPKNVP